MSFVNRRSAIGACLPLALPFALAAGPASGQTPPDAGSLQQQFERDRALPLPPRAPLAFPAESAPLQLVDGVTVTVKAFRFSGSTLLDASRLQAVVASYLNRPIGFAELQKASRAVAQAYRDAGWVVRTMLPAQDIADGTVTIQVVEARLGKIEANGRPPARVALDQITALFDAQRKPGQPLNGDALDRALLLANDLPGVLVSGNLREGSGEQETDLVLNTEDRPLLQGQVTVDNTGSRSTGSDRVLGSVSLNSPLKLGDLVGVDAIHSSGSDYLRVADSLPVGDLGWRVGVNASALRYRLVTADFSALQAHGNSQTVGLESSYPIVRARTANLYLGANLDHKVFNNESDGAVSTRYQSDAGSLGLNGNLYDELAGGGANTASLTFSDGRLDLNGSPNAAADAATTRTGGAFAKLRYAIGRTQTLTESVSFYANLSGQLADRNLDSSEKFYLGGASGVRAFPADEGGGSEGSLLTLELREHLPRGFSTTEFYDAGRVVVDRDHDFSSAPRLNSYRLSGAGLALAWRSSSGLQLQATWAHRLHSNPDPTATGNDQDGSLALNRLWLTATLAF